MFEPDFDTEVIVEPVYHVVIDLLWGNVSSVGVDKNNFYGFGWIDFDAPAMEKYCKLGSVDAEVVRLHIWCFYFGLGT